MTPSEYTALLLARLPAIIQDELEKSEYILTAYISMRMNEGENPMYDSETGRFRKVTKAKPYIKNSTGKLYTNSKALLNAAVNRNDEGYALDTEIDGTDVKLTHDFEVMKEEVPYAAIHEFGGKAGRGKKVTIPARPYIKPAFEKFAEKIGASLIVRINKRLGAIA